LVSLLRRRLHPRAPLFPYTTLFRSRGPTGDVVPPRAERAGGRRAWFRQVGRPLAIGRKCRSRSHQRTLAAGRQARRVGGVATLREWVGRGERGWCHRSAPAPAIRDGGAVRHAARGGETQGVAR